MYTQPAPAKINLGLHVLRRRSDGYHDIESVLLPVGWRDTLTVRPAEHLTMTCTDATLPTDERNLCLQAARRLASEAGISRGAAIHLDKQIPHGAGLGGGSSDAAATLQLLTKLWDLSYGTEQLQAIAGRIGSDVPFFIEGRPALIRGRGTEVQPLDEQYDFPFTLVVVKPAVSIATPDAYGLVTPLADGRPDLRTLVTSNDLGRWRSGLINDFEQPVFDTYPEVAELKRWLQNNGAAYASLSGSGAAVYGVYAHETAARGAAEKLRSRPGHRVWSGGMFYHSDRESSPSVETLRISPGTESEGFGSGVR